jgi:hypothetical protein
MLVIVTLEALKASQIILKTDSSRPDKSQQWEAAYYFRSIESLVV